MDQMDPAHFDPVLSNLLMQYMLLKVGGQVTIDLVDVAQMQKDYLGTRIMFDRNTNIMVLTLRSAEGENDRPKQKLE